jgi:hypothetical protein
LFIAPNDPAACLPAAFNSSGEGFEFEIGGAMASVATVGGMASGVATAVGAGALA